MPGLCRLGPRPASHALLSGTLSWSLAKVKWKGGFGRNRPVGHTLRIPRQGQALDAEPALPPGR